MFGASRKRAGFIVAAVVCCSLLVAACLSAFIGHSSRASTRGGHSLSEPPNIRFFEHGHSPREISVHLSARSMRLSTHPHSSRSSAASASLQHFSASRSSHQLSRITVGKTQMRRVNADVKPHARLSGLGSSGKSVSAASASADQASVADHIMSQAQFSAAVKKLSSGRAAVDEGLSTALEKMGKLRQEEALLHKELEATLGRISSMKIITSMDIAVPDGMGGTQMEVVITRPVGGTSTAKVIKGQNGVVAAAQNAASAGAGHSNKQLPPFAPHDSVLGSDGLGGSQSPLAPESVLRPLAAGTAGGGMTSEVKGDDGLGGRIRSAAVAVTNFGPNNAAFRLHDQRTDGVGGSGKRLFRRRSNTHMSKGGIMNKVRRNDGVGGDVRYREARNLKKIPRNRIRRWSRDCSDGLGGKASWCTRVFSASSSHASAVKAVIRAALGAHDTAAKQRAGYVPHRGKAGGKQGNIKSAEAGAQNDSGDDGGDDADGSAGGDFSNFDGASGGTGDFGGKFNADGSNGDFSSGSMGEFKDGGHNEAGGSFADAQNNGGSGDGSGSIGDFRDQQQPQEQSSPSSDTSTDQQQPQEQSSPSSDTSTDQQQPQEQSSPSSDTSTDQQHPQEQSSPSSDTSNGSEDNSNAST